MTRSELVELLAKKLPSLLGQREAEHAVKVLQETITHALVRGQRIEIRGFGSFMVHQRAPRQGRNPRTGEQVAVPAKRVVHFKPGKALRQAVDKQPGSAADT
ncbi:MAG: integration host factor subunit beta [Comamonas sp.]|nr:integration host factor subunit beta [Comamonas sp.]